jgi:glucuronate isomerase
MIKPFIHEDFLLGTDAARELYRRHAAPQPILDYHNHLPPRDIAENRQFGDLWEAWLEGDHYKWRAMRANGVTEAFCTGKAAPREKFDAWARTVPYTLRNPLYHWTHLELKRIFGIDVLLSPDTAAEVWHTANGLLPSLRVHDLLAKFDVRALCTTDDPADPLDWHAKIATSGLPTKVFPTFRPDKATAVDDAGYNAWLEKLGQTAGMQVGTFDDLLSALKKRHDDFHAAGCRLSDHGLEQCPPVGASHAEAARIFDAARSGRAATPEDRDIIAGFILLEVGRWNAAKGWTMQLHLGARRNNNSPAMASLGRDTGFDSIADLPQVDRLARFLDTLESSHELPKTVIYNLNPGDNYAFATMAGNFQDGFTAGKIQFGAAWWFLDQKDGITLQLDALSQCGLLRRFIGMLTDSRSFLSFPRHEYFRRILCDILGSEMESGQLPDDAAMIGAMVREICYGNAQKFLGLPGVEPAAVDR